MPTSNIIVPPSIASTLPSIDRLHHALANAASTLPAGLMIYRAVRHLAAVIPPYVTQTYRFGPPTEFIGVDGRHPRYWMYGAQELNTALWESGFCANDFTQAGTFYIPAVIANDGLIATFTLQVDIRILDLDGTVLSKLGIYDRIHEPSHEWCQWFGLRMLEVLESFSVEGAPIGFRYPSRKHKSHLALAVRSGALDQWRQQVDIQVRRFAEMSEFEALRADASYAEPLGGGFSLD